LLKKIVFLGNTTAGRHHDYTLLKTAFPPEHPWFELITILVDLGFQGIKSDYVGDDIHIPHKKPRKSKNNPDPKLTDQQKAVNKALSQVRILVENAIAGLKRYNILNHPFRNRSAGFDDLVVSVCAGLWNFCLS
jgi:hypothetical protein